jgi:hypothetical protein
LLVCRKSPRCENSLAVLSAVVPMFEQIASNVMLGGVAQPDRKINRRSVNLVERATFQNVTRETNRHRTLRRDASDSEGAMRAIDYVPGIVHRLYELVAELEGHFPGRRFTPDGHLIGSLGEVLASYYYALELLPCSTECHDARTADGRLVQVKATQSRSVALRGEPEHLLALLLKRDGTIEEIYNGPGQAPWNSAGPMGKNGQRPLSISKLRALMESVPVKSRLSRFAPVT